MALCLVVDLIPNKGIPGTCRDRGADGEGEPPVPCHLQQAHHSLPFGAVREVAHPRETMSKKLPAILQRDRMLGWFDGIALGHKHHTRTTGRVSMFGAVQCGGVCASYPVSPRSEAVSDLNAAVSLVARKGVGGPSYMHGAILFGHIANLDPMYLLASWATDARLQRGPP